MRQRLQRLYDLLYLRYGPQHWWPGDTPLEVTVGAVLTQNTNWVNVEKAIANLKKARKLSVAAINSMPANELAELIRPAGYFNVKAKRLQNLIRMMVAEYRGSLKRMQKEPLPRIRERLLEVNGIGPETADSIILYALGMPVFVIDAYTKRVLSRHNIAGPDVEYDSLQALFHENLEEDSQLFNEYHALIVRVAKEHCRTRPICPGCPLEGF